MTVVLDASAVLAALLAEEGAEVVLDQLADAHLATVNMSEVLTKLIEYGLSAKQARKQLARFELNIHDFDAEQAECTALLRQRTKQFGLSLGDRACLALAQRLMLPILTADRRMWDSRRTIGLQIRLIR